ncbi:unnamed protein product [Rhizopus stolonifer]
MGGSSCCNNSLAGGAEGSGNGRVNNKIKMPTPNANESTNPPVKLKTTANVRNRLSFVRIWYNNLDSSVD